MERLKRIFSDKLVIFSTVQLAAILVLAGCRMDSGDVDTGTPVGDSRCYLYVVERDGHKFAVVVSTHGCSLTEIKD